MRIIVTGSESFVARELIAQCLKEGIEVFGFDFAKASDLPYEFKKGDINDPNIGDIFPESADAIVHLAALSRNEDCAGKPYETFMTNVMGTLNLVKAAKARGVKQLIFASSDWVYEKFAEGEQKNEDSVIDIAGHTSEYALSKLVSEANLRQVYLRDNSMGITVLRFAIIYGPRPMKIAGSVERIASEAKTSETITFSGSRKSGRCYNHVADTAGGIRAALGRTDFQIINIAGDEFVTLEHIVRITEKLCGKAQPATILEKDPSAVVARNISNKKAKEFLGWKPAFNIESGFKTILPYI
ncbi:MAG: NAD(P)-dependent oxidoreductase [bacterium]|nr:NAD(P)-dependent oxidoreductase [bacterium]